jgi:hypothetical protein
LAKRLKIDVRKLLFSAAAKPIFRLKPKPKLSELKTWQILSVKVKELTKIIDMFWAVCLTFVQVDSFGCLFVTFRHSLVSKLDHRKTFRQSQIGSLKIKLKSH